MNDPIVEEVRKYRDEHARQFNYDLDAICTSLMQNQTKRGRKLRSRAIRSTISRTEPRVRGPVD